MTVMEETECPYCAEKINIKAKKCKHCNEMLDQTMRELDLLKSQKKDVYVTNNAASSASATAPSAYAYPIERRNKTTAILLCFFLGWMGGHKFYLGRTISGLVYLCLCWTLLPLIASFFETIYLIVMSQQEFDIKFNSASYRYA